MTELKPYLVILMAAMSLMGIVQAAVKESQQSGAGLGRFLVAVALAFCAYWLWSQK